MLNLGFSGQYQDAFGSRYAIPDDLAARLVAANSDFSTGPELRRQAVFGDELWSRIDGLGLGTLDWAQLDVLDICSGTGFLAFHLLSRTTPASLTLVDVASDELAAARDLLAESLGAMPEVLCADVTNLDIPPRSFDVVIGNSFAHHLPDVPKAFSALRRLLRPGGWFVGLHEPTPMAVPLESGDLRHLALRAAAGDRYFSLLRFKGASGVRPGTTDIWMFDAPAIERMLLEAGFEEVRVTPRYLTRPFVVAALGLHLSGERKRLSGGGSRAIDWSVKLDNRLAQILPGRIFGGLSFAARR